EGVLVLGIERVDGRYVGAPTGDATFRAGDVVLLYGRIDALRRIDQRRRDAGGELEHVLAVAEHDQVVEAEAAEAAELGPAARRGAPAAPASHQPATDAGRT